MKKIMLIDDKNMSNFIMKKYFEIKASNHKVYEFVDAEFAFSKVSELNPDVIFLDLNMPLMDGWQFLKAMKKANFNNKVAILTSSTSHEDLKESGNYLNVIDFFVKPFDAEELARILDSV